MPFRTAEAAARTLGSIAETWFAIRVRPIALTAPLAFRPPELPLLPRPEIPTAPRSVLVSSWSTAGPESRAASEVLARASMLAGTSAKPAGAPSLLTGSAGAARPGRTVIAVLSTVAAVARTASRTRTSVEPSLVVMVWQIDFRS